MAKLVRFGVSMDERLLGASTGSWRGAESANRSEAIRDLIRGEQVRESWEKGRGRSSPP